MKGLDRSIEQVTAHLNLKTGAGFVWRTKRGLTTGGTFIKARLEEGHSVATLINVIDAKCAQWAGTRWEKYLRPSTLFNKEKCGDYIGQLGLTIRSDKPSSPHDWLNDQKEDDHASR